METLNELLKADVGPGDEDEVVEDEADTATFAMTEDFDSDDDEDDDFDDEDDENFADGEFDEEDDPDDEE